MWNILSWNTLLREYEKKYRPDSLILKRFPNEEERIDNIINLILDNIDNNCLVCLQECSKLLLKKIEKCFSNTHKIFNQNIRENEYLITITPFGFKKRLWPFHPTANGYLVVENGKFRLVNTHLIPQEYVKFYSVLDYIFYLPRDFITVVAGDFNANWMDIYNKLSNRFIIPNFGRTYKKSSVDHIIFDKEINMYRKLDTIKNILSDHNAIKIYF